MKHLIDWSKIRIELLSGLIGICSAYFGQPLIHGNEQAINIIVTVFSILAGFIVAIIAIVGDPVLLPPGTWRAAEMEFDKLKKRLIRHKWLFTIYLLTLCFIFLALLFQKDYFALTVWLERAFLFFGAFGFALSLQLPSVLMKLQRERIEAIIEHRRHTDGILDQTKTNSNEMLKGNLSIPKTSVRENDIPH